MTAPSSVLFASDIHLSAERPAQANDFLALIGRLEGRAQSLYLLGDVFDAWIGDDHQTALHSEVAEALGRLSGTGTAVYLMHGNHDFLIGEDYAGRCGATLLADPSVVDAHGHRLLLSHGDIYCTDDTEYQQFRRWSREPANQRAFLSLPIPARAQQAAALQEKSRATTRGKSSEIMDVNDEAIVGALREHAVDVLVHGHTHRPALHSVQVDGQPCRRFVMGAWHETVNARVLLWPASGAPILLAPDEVDTALG